MVKTLPSNAGGASSIPGWGANGKEMGRKSKKRGDICILIADSLCSWLVAKISKQKTEAKL